MRGFALVILAFAAVAACTPGSGENGSCQSTTDCQVNLDCIAGLVPDGGSICKTICTLGGQSCPAGEVCLAAPTSGFYCGPDGGTL